MTDFLNKLQATFKARSKLHLFLIFLIFSISGSVSIFVSDLLLKLLRLESSHIPIFIFWPLKIFVIILSYQIILLLVSACFGELKYFSKYSLKILNLFKKPQK